MNLPSLGVGITYIPELDALLKSKPHIIDLLEIEPQVHWYQVKSDDAYIIDEQTLENIRSFNCPKVLHSVGTPVGGTIGPDPNQISNLSKMICYFGAPWISEHLSFNRVRYKNSDFNTGFLLPPLQTQNGASQIAKSINSMAKQMPIPFCIENGVNYLSPYEGELPDGQFVSEVIKATGCGLLLDLHNAYTNELNGRQSLNDFLNAVPLDRVWELHLAGGSEDDGYWLDSHAGRTPKSLIDIAYSLVPRLVNLRAIVFEIGPSHLSSVGFDTVYSELKTLHKIWDSRENIINKKKGKTLLKKGRVSQHKKTQNNKRIKTLKNLSPLEWEYTLGSLIVGRPVENILAVDLTFDRGLNMIRKIVASSRASMVVRVLRLTSRLLMLTLGVNQFKELLSGYWQESTPKIFANVESEGFARYLEKRQLNVKYLDEILKLEMAILYVTIHGNTQKVQFKYDPIPIINALVQRKLPDSNLSPENIEVEVRPDNINMLKDSVNLS